MSLPPIEQQITFLYTADLPETARFYEEVMGFPLVRDQGTCRIYQVSTDGYLGICQRDGAVIDADRRTLILTLVTPDVDGWYAALRARGVVFEEPPQVNPRYRIYHCFLRDPNGYQIEIQRFLED
ncbi:MAG: VOC family protein [Anaerolineae bacterium]|nr:VOC family protein [Anaerolineae bacterium]